MRNLINNIRSIIEAVTHPFVTSSLGACEYCHEVMGVESTFHFQLMGYTLNLVNSNYGTEYTLLVITPSKNKEMNLKLEQDQWDMHLRDMECARTYSNELEAIIMTKDEEIKNLKALLAEQK
jgi:hypothetical protein